MKKIIVALLFMATQVMVAQTLSYNDAGVLFSKEKINGTARYNAMSGAFGALGGDISAIDINPASGSVFLNSDFSFTLGFRNHVTDASFYNTTITSENDYTDVSQIGGVLVFNTSRYNNRGWNKMALTFNYSVVNDFESQWVAKGNSNNPTFVYHPNDNKIEYKQSKGQSFESVMDGANKKYSFGFSTKYNNDLYLGASINTHDIYFSQRTKLIENNYNSTGTLEADFRQGLAVTGSGISLSLGVISRPVKNLRLGLAYHSPTWYNLTEEYIKEDSNVFVNGVNVETKRSGVNAYEYKLKTPSRLTGSIAYTFGKKGLISLDYTHKNYRKIKYQSGDFTKENQSFSDNLKSVGELRIGTEWNVKHFSFRGGYHYEGSPYKGAKSSDALDGFSLGAGYKFRGGKFDLAYQRSTNTAPYNFYPEFNDINSSELDHKIGTITATLTLSL